MIDKTLKIYFDEIAKYKPLSKSKERELVLRVRKGDKKAQDELIKANLRFVIKVASHYRNQGVEFEDLINIGNKGLLKSLDYFDESKDFRLISYAVWWIRQNILVAMAEQSRPVKIPLQSVLLINKIRKVYGKLEQKYQRPITDDDVAIEIKKPKETVEIYRMVDTPKVSLNKEIVEDIELIDTVVDEEKLNDWIFKLKIEALINMLKRERDREVIKMFFGIGYDGYFTLKVISEKLNLSLERVRQIKEEALIDLRKAIKKMKNIERIKDVYKVL